MFLHNVRIAFLHINFWCFASGSEHEITYYDSSYQLSTLSFMDGCSSFGVLHSASVDGVPGYLVISKV
jgi:hypothetical protein